MYGAVKFRSNDSFNLWNGKDLKIGDIALVFLKKHLVNAAKNYLVSFVTFYSAICAHFVFWRDAHAQQNPSSSILEYYFALCSLTVIPECYGPRFRRSRVRPPVNHSS